MPTNENPNRHRQPIVKLKTISRQPTIGTMWASSRIQTLPKISGNSSRRTFVVVKLDIDVAAIEVPLAKELLQDDELVSLVVDVFNLNITSLSTNSNIIGAQVWRVPSTRVSSYLEVCEKRCRFALLGMMTIEILYNHELDMLHHLANLLLTCNPQKCALQQQALPRTSSFSFNFIVA